MIQYSQNGCPMCDQLKQKQDTAGISYTVEMDVNEMQRLGITHVPMLHVNDRIGLLDYAGALKFIAEGGLADACC